MEKLYQVGGISQLDTGASDITYTGNEGPKSPQQIADEDFMLLEEYQKYVFEMQEQGLEPMSIEEFRQEAMSGMASNNRMQQRRQMVKEGGIARLGFRRGGRRGDTGQASQSESKAASGGGSNFGGGDDRTSICSHYSR